MSGYVRDMSACGTSRYSDTGCSAAIRSAMRQSQREVTSATVGSRYRPRNDMAELNTPERALSDLLSTSRAADATTSDERRVGAESVSTCISRLLTYHSHKQIKQKE